MQLMRDKDQVVIEEEKFSFVDDLLAVEFCRLVQPNIINGN